MRLPGQAPEAYIFDRILDVAATKGGLLAVRLLQPFETADKVGEKLKEIRLTNHDPHVLFSQVGSALGFILESTVRDAFLTTWAEAFPDEARVVIQPIESLLPLLPVA
jgi:hypothetical protein